MSLNMLRASETHAHSSEGSVSQAQPLGTCGRTLGKGVGGSHTWLIPPALAKMTPNTLWNLFEPLPAYLKQGITMVL